MPPGGALLPAPADGAVPGVLAPALLPSANTLPQPARPFATFLSLTSVLTCWSAICALLDNELMIGFSAALKAVTSLVEIAVIGG